MIPLLVSPSKSESRESGGRSGGEAATLNREEKMVARRTFIKGASLAVLVASTSRIYVRDGLAQQAPNSSGTEPAKLKAPAGACDCHRGHADRVPCDAR
jgi:hypothetical protein